MDTTAQRKFSVACLQKTKTAGTKKAAAEIVRHRLSSSGGAIPARCPSSPLQSRLRRFQERIREAMLHCPARMRAQPKWTCALAPSAGIRVRQILPLCRCSVSPHYRPPVSPIAPVRRPAFSHLPPPPLTSRCRRCCQGCRACSACAGRRPV